MSLELDQETLQALGWGTDVSESTTHYVSAPKPSRTPPGEVDGRSRRNWRHKRQDATKGEPMKAQGETA